MLFDISGRVALVTGGRRGLGLAMSEGLAAAGVKVAVAAASPDCEQLSRRIAACGGTLAYFQADLAERSQRTAWWTRSSIAWAVSIFSSTMPAFNIANRP